VTGGTALEEHWKTFEIGYPTFQ